MKTLLLPVLGVATFFILLFIYTKLFGPIPFSVNSVTTTKSQTFDVVGEGKVSAAVDVANLSVGARAQAPSVKEAQDQINAVINKVSEAIKSIGIDSKDIQSANYNINPDIDYSQGSQRIKGYTANTTLSIKVRDITKANDVIDTATKNGANEVSGINFAVDDKEKAENQAREKAVTDAKRKAEAASKIAGFKLGRIVNYSENFGDFPRPVLLEAQKTQIEPGSSEIVVTVTLSYEIY